MEPWDKVILYGVFDGMNLSSDGSRDILVTLENGDRVDIPEYFTRKASDFIEKDKLKLKDVIARIKKLDLDSQDVWLNEILNELGSDYGSLKYRAGYEQGKFDSTMEHEKVTVPQFVADWYEEHKDDFEIALFRCIDHIPSVYDEGDLNEFEEWIIDSETKPFQTLVNMHQFGYTVEKEKRYRVKMKGFDDKHSLLKYGEFSETWYFDDTETNVCIRKYHTRKQIEEAGFGEVFNNPLFEVEEMKKNE